MDTDNLQGG